MPGSVGAWAFSEEGSSIVDSAFALDGTVSFGALGYRLTAGGLALRGTGYATLGDPSELRFSTGMTLSFWMKSHQTGGQVVLGRYDPLSNRRCYQFHIDGDSFNFQVSQDGSSDFLKHSKVAVNYSGAALQNSWVHVTGTYEGTAAGSSRLTLYLNGERVSETQSAVFPVYAVPGVDFVIGAAHDKASYRFNGTIAQLNAFNRPLSDDEVALLYEMTEELTEDAAAEY